MPFAAPRICGCGRKISGPCLCSEHRDRARRAAFDKTRPSAAIRGYGAEWRKVREGVLRLEPNCRLCAAQGARVEAVEVDHIDGDPMNNRTTNLRPLCRRHHSQRTARDQAFGRKGRTFYA